MQITLNQDEILEALEAYVRNQIVIAPDHSIEIDLKAGRGENGFTATLDIRSSDKKAIHISKPTVLEVVADDEESDDIEVFVESEEPTETKEEEFEEELKKPGSIFNFSKPAE